jgi:Ribosome biogenesis protein SLX9
LNCSLCATSVYPSLNNISTAVNLLSVQASKGLAGMTGLLDTLDSVMDEADSEAAEGTGTKPRVEKARAKQGAQFRRIVTNKGKKSIAAHEISQLSAVLGSTAFRSDPFAAIQAHLKATVPQQQPSSTTNSASTKAAAQHSTTQSSKQRRK